MAAPDTASTSDGKFVLPTRLKYTVRTRPGAQGRVCAGQEMRIEIMILDIVQNNQGDKQTAKHLMHWMRQEHSAQFCKEQAQ